MPPVVRNRRQPWELTDADVVAALARIREHDDDLAREAEHIYDTLTWGEGPGQIRRAGVQDWLWYRLARFGPELWEPRAGRDWSLWDLWFCVVAVRDHDGNLDALAEVFVDSIRRPGGGSRDASEAQPSPRPARTTRRRGPGTCGSGRRRGPRRQAHHAT